MSIEGNDRDSIDAAAWDCFATKAHHLVHMDSCAPLSPGQRILLACMHDDVFFCSLFLLLRLLQDVRASIHTHTRTHWEIGCNRQCVHFCFRGSFLIEHDALLLSTMLSSLVVSFVKFNQFSALGQYFPAHEHTNTKYTRADVHTSRNRWTAEEFGRSIEHTHYVGPFGWPTPHRCRVILFIACAFIRGCAIFSFSIQENWFALTYD